MPVLRLTLLCEKVLMQNHMDLRDLGDTRYQLIHRVLSKFSAQQLKDLEANNPKLMLDDEPIWLNLVRKDFPQDVHERFTTNAGKIKSFFKLQLDEVGFDYSDLNLDNYIKYEQLGDSKKYRLPSRLLYMKYQEDYLKKEELAIENLRQRMQAIKKDKEQNRVVHIDDVIELTPNNSGLKRFKRPGPERSKIFMKSQLEAKNRKSLFKNPLGPDSVAISNRKIRAPKSVPKPFPTKIMKPEPPQLKSPVKEVVMKEVRPKPVSPIARRSTSSIFHRAKPRPTIRSPKSVAPEPKPQPKEAPEAPADKRRKINMGEYKARRM